nr:MAG TPA: hypothetical protein [Caudoviricetes sp.]DAP41368.1 MAG TPA: hypothetical protein [Caudoviricetes sp.]
MGIGNIFGGQFLSQLLLFILILVLGFFMYYYMFVVITIPFRFVWNKIKRRKE